MAVDEDGAGGDEVADRHATEVAGVSGGEALRCKRPSRNRAARGVGEVCEYGLELVAMWVAAGMPTRHIAF